LDRTANHAGKIIVKHFILELEGEHIEPSATLAHLGPLHHAFLQSGHDRGHFLFSGPQIPPHGSFLAARAESWEVLEALLAEEPFAKAGKLKFKRVLQYDPVQHQPLLKPWFAGAAAGEMAALAAAIGPSVGQMHFLLEGEHIVPFEQRAGELIAAHRAFLQAGYDKGDFLLSGPTIPPTGGVLVARAASRVALDAMLAEEPYCKAGVMRFVAVAAFHPIMHQAALRHWFGVEAKAA
jgi:uncharacterized protein YciI